MINKRLVVATLFLLLLTVTLALEQASVAKAQEDPSLFIYTNGSVQGHGTGWYAGYVITGQSGTYTLEISANGAKKLFPVTNVHIIIPVSTEARQGDLKSIAIDGNPITLTTFTKGIPPIYNKQGGPFKETDYYDYISNTQTKIADLTYAAADYPKNWVSHQITITFSSTATVNSKVMILVSGTDSAGNAALTPFSEGLLFVMPEYLLGSLLALTACFAAFVVFKKRSKFPSSQQHHLKQPI